VTAGEDAGQPGQIVQAEPTSDQPTIIGRDERRDEPQGEAVASPAKIMRIGAMVRQLLDEVRHAPLDEVSRSRMREIYDISVKELAEGLSPDLADELERIALPLSNDTPSESELRVAQAQLVGWLEGLFHGIQATLFAQQMAARNQLAEMRRGALPSPPREREAGDQSGPGQYL
jgi:hypothetical protein